MLKKTLITMTLLATLMLSACIVSATNLNEDTEQIGMRYKYIERVSVGLKRGYLDAYPKFKTKKYDVYYGIKGTSNETKKGTGTARKAISVSYTKYNKYK